MTKTGLSGGTVHNMPSDLREALVADKTALESWESLTALARNEWICWTITVKLPATRKKHVERTVKELSDGKRRPCCWIGCIHRTDKPISPSVHCALAKQSKKS